MLSGPSRPHCHGPCSTLNTGLCAGRQHWWFAYPGPFKDSATIGVMPENLSGAADFCHARHTVAAGPNPRQRVASGDNGPTGARWAEGMRDTYHVMTDGHYLCDNGRVSGGVGPWPFGRVFRAMQRPVATTHSRRLRFDLIMTSRK